MLRLPRATTATTACDVLLLLHKSKPRPAANSANWSSSRPRAICYPGHYLDTISTISTNSSLPSLTISSSLSSHLGCFHASSCSPTISTPSIHTPTTTTTPFPSSDAPPLLSRLSFITSSTTTNTTPMPTPGLNASLSSARGRIRAASPGTTSALFKKQRTGFPRHGSSSTNTNNNDNSTSSTAENPSGQDNTNNNSKSSGSKDNTTANDHPDLPSSSYAPSSPLPPRPVELRNMSDAEISKYLKQNHDRLFQNNKAWADEQRSRDPNFFVNLSAGQTPEYLWIGCADSRIPAEQIVGLEPGEAFIHRNIANLVCNTDLNAMGVINYAVRHLGVKHVVVCGHYGCGGVKAAMTPKDLGLLNPWLRNIRDIYRLYEKELDSIEDENDRYKRLVELNVLEQCRNVMKTADVQQSYAENKYPIVHGWVFNFEDGLVTDLKFDFESVLVDIQKIYNLTN